MADQIEGSKNEDLYIDGKLVTETNARRFVKARAPKAKANRITSKFGYRGLRHYVTIKSNDDQTPWCSATADTAGEAWLRVARQMVAFDKRVATEKKALGDTLGALEQSENKRGEREAAALRYAAVLIEQHQSGSAANRAYWAAELRAMADAEEASWNRK